MMSVERGRQASFPFDCGRLATATQTEVSVGNMPRLTEWAPERWPVADDWRPVVDQFLATEAARKLGHFMRERLQSGAIIYPPQPFRALALTPLAQVKVVILGQDPYHRTGQAEGLAFSVAPGVKPPPSLRNIFKEIARDHLLEGVRLPAHGDGSLVRWARQGVLLLNTCLTVEEGQPASHARQGWEGLTDGIVKAVAEKTDFVGFLLWGAHAQAKQGLIAQGAASHVEGGAAHLVLVANHPSPLSALRSPKPFLGCGHFGQINEFLKQHGCTIIQW